MDTLLCPLCQIKEEGEACTECLAKRYNEAVRLLQWCSDHWNENALKEYSLPESFDKIVHNMHDGVIFKDVPKRF